jgi:hypothetical protein
VEPAWRRSAVSEAWSLWGPVVVTALIAIPFAVWLATVIARRRIRAGWPAAWAIRVSRAEVLMVAGTLPWIWMTLTPNHDQPRGLDMRPLHDLVHQVHVGIGYATLQIGGNLLVFAALGFGIPIRWRVRPVVALAVGVLGSATIETLQWVLDLGRFSSIDDVIVNAAGAYAAAWCARRWWLRRSGVYQVGRIELDGERLGEQGAGAGTDAVGEPVPGTVERRVTACRSAAHRI